MSFDDLLTVLIGGGGVGAIIAAIMTRQTAKDQNKIDLLDRAYKEIERLEAKIDELETELKNERQMNDELQRVLFELREQVNNLRIELKTLKGE